jgi:hypothetical protein
MPAASGQILVSPFQLSAIGLGLLSLSLGIALLVFRLYLIPKAERDTDKLRDPEMPEPGPAPPDPKPKLIQDGEEAAIALYITGGVIVLLTFGVAVK